MDNIQTWAQGYFVYSPQYRGMTQEQKDEANIRESHLVRSSPMGKAICRCPTPEDAKWIASRLNLASILEE